jgi:hypothetical protein
MKKYLSILLVILVLLGCDLSTSIVPTEANEDMAATVNSIMTDFPTIESLPTKEPTSQPTLMAPIPSFQTTLSGSIQPTVGQGTPQLTPLTTISGTQQSTVAAITTTPTITPTFLPEDPRNTLGPPSWIDTYTNGNNWPQTTDKYTSVLFENGTMKMTALTSIGDGWRLTYPNIANFYLEANFQTGTCEKTDHFGIIFRVPDISAANQGYFYGIQCDGKYFMKVFAENVMTTEFVKSSTTIVTGKDAVNRLGIMAEGDKLSLYINGVLVKELNDTHFTRGGFGIFVGSDYVKNLTVTVDEIAYWSLP